MPTDTSARRFELFDDRCRAPFVRARHGIYRPGYHVPAHRHAFLHLLYVRSGGLQLQLGHERQLRPGDIACIVPGDGHELRMDRALGLELFDCCIDGESELGRWFLELGSDTFTEDQPLSPLVDAIRREGGVDELHGELALNGLLAQFAAACARALRNHHRAGSTEADAAATVAALEQVIERRYPEELHLDDLAAAVHYSAKHLCRLVRQERGSTPMAMLRAARMRHAQARLLAGDEAIAAIAASCGYGDPQHFARRFKAEIGTTPSAFRANRSEA